jgi:predicted GNAT family acetyltransferase
MIVTHEPDHHRFVVRLPEGEGRLLYRDAGPHLINIWHTEVDPALRGQGVGDALVRRALTWAREAGFRVIPGCPFVRDWFAQHPEQNDLAAPAHGE